MSAIIATPFPNRKVTLVKEPVVQLAQPARTNLKLPTCSSMAASAAPSASSSAASSNPPKWKQRPQNPTSKNRVYVRPGAPVPGPRNLRNPAAAALPATTTIQKTIIGVNRAIPCTFRHNPQAVVNVILASPPTNGAYPNIAEHLSTTAAPISVLQIVARETFDEATEDLANAIVWLSAQSEKPVVLMGWASAAAALPWVTQMFQYDPKRIPAIILLSTVPDERTAQALPELQCERLLIHGKADPTTNPQTMSKIMDQCATGLKYLRVLDDANHTLKAQEQPLFALLDEFMSYLLKSL